MVIVRSFNKRLFTSSSHRCQSYAPYTAAPTPAVAVRPTAIAQCATNALRGAALRGGLARLSYAVASRARWVFRL